VWCNDIHCFVDHPHVEPENMPFLNSLGEMRFQFIFLQCQFEVSVRFVGLKKHSQEDNKQIWSCYANFEARPKAVSVFAWQG